MDAILGLFRQAIAEENGYKLAEAITPVAPPDDAGRLYSFHRGTSAFNIQETLRNEIIYKSSVRLPKTESHAWIEVFACYWKAIGELLAAEEAANQGKKADCKKAYDAWKEVVNALHRGYTANTFEAWTIPCLYTSGKYLRNLALKADEQVRKSDGNVTYNQGLQDDAVSTIGKNDNLQDAARQINRIFSLCVSDRYAEGVCHVRYLSAEHTRRAPLEESRKWGVYYVTNLLFKIYFKVSNSWIIRNSYKLTGLNSLIRSACARIFCDPSVCRATKCLLSTNSLKPIK
jgi:hypothetical protein